MNNPGEGSDKAVHPAPRLVQGPPVRLQAASIQRVIARTIVLTTYEGRTGSNEINLTHVDTFCQGELTYVVATPPPQRDFFAPFPPPHHPH